MSSVPGRWLTIAQAADYTGYAKGTLYNFVGERRIPHVKKRRTLRFDRDALDRWMLRDMIPSVDDF